MTAGGRHWRRWILRAALCLLLGAVTTVGVAWGFSLAPPPPPRRLPGVAVAPRPWPLPVPRDWIPKAAVIQSETIGCTQFDAIWIAYPPGQSPHMISGSEPVYYMVGLSSGWPMQCLYSQRRASTTVARFAAPMLWPPVRFQDGIGLPWNQRIFPVVPLWRGLLTNVLLYAAACWLIFFAPTAVRRFQRRRRGRCLHCGYDLAGLPGGTVPGGTVLRTVIDEDAGGTGAHEDTARRAVPPTCPECGSANT